MNEVAAVIVAVIVAVVVFFLLKAAAVALALGGIGIALAALIALLAFFACLGGVKRVRL